MALHEASLVLPLSGRAAVLLNLSDPGQLPGNKRLAVASTRPEPAAPHLHTYRERLELVRAGSRPNACSIGKHRTFLRGKEHRLVTVFVGKVAGSTHGVY